VDFPGQSRPPHRRDVRRYSGDGGASPSPIIFLTPLEKPQAILKSLNSSGLDASGSRLVHLPHLDAPVASE
jgi:hypothetical protein